ncbi:MAG TPA: MBL fold metallo-hydrolase [Bacteroidales bacterium]|jgi:glyoxylase-like metal-dependent hydrolase (beta-lactamase superfamily II)|nr:MBL fold metallo-hydrolase [Bacteroidales bacterium]
MNVYAIETGNFKLDGGAIFGVVPKTIWGAKYPADDKNLCNFCMRCLLIEVDNRRILIDCGMGNTMPENLLKYYYINGDDTLLGSLLACGVEPEQITDVVLSHLHFDHCGGAVTKHTDGSLHLTFPNAQYWVGKSQWESALKPNRRERPSFLKDNIEPLQHSGKLNLIDSTTIIAPDVELRLYNGHTLGQIIPFIHYKNKTLVYTADFIPTSVHIPVSFVCGYDIYPLQTMDETEAFLQEAVEKNYVLFFEHDIQVECCDLIQTPKGVAIGNVFTLEEFKASVN